MATEHQQHQPEHHQHEAWAIDIDAAGNQFVIRTGGGFSIVCVLVDSEQQDAALIASAPCLVETLWKVHEMLNEIGRRISDPWLRVFVEETEERVWRALVKAEGNGGVGI